MIVGVVASFLHLLYYKTKLQLKHRIQFLQRNWNSALKVSSLQLLARRFCGNMSTQQKRKSQNMTRQITRWYLVLLLMFVAIVIRNFLQKERSYNVICVASGYMLVVKALNGINTVKSVSWLPLNRIYRISVGKWLYKPCKSDCGRVDIL